MFSFAAGVRIALSRDKSVRNSPFDKSNMFFYLIKSIIVFAKI